MTSNRNLAPYDAANADTRSTWIAVRNDGRQYASADGDTYAQIRDDGKVDLLILERDGKRIAFGRTDPDDTPWFSRRVRAGVMGAISGLAYEWGSCIGWRKRDGAFDVIWLLHDGRIVPTDTIDPPDEFA